MSSLICLIAGHRFYWKLGNFASDVIKWSTSDFCTRCGKKAEL